LWNSEKLLAKLTRVFQIGALSFQINQINPGSKISTLLLVFCFHQQHKQRDSIPDLVETDITSVAGEKHQ